MDKRLQAFLILLLAIGLQVAVARVMPDQQVVAGVLGTIVTSLSHSLLASPKKADEEQLPEDEK